MSLTQNGPLLALDSSTAFGSVAVGGADAIMAEVAVNVRGGHSSALMPAIDFALSSTGLTPRDLRGVVVGSGPGSFTGVRIAAATAKGIVRALEVPLYAFSSLLAAAFEARAAAGAVCALFDARGRDVFVIVCDFTAGVEIVHPPSAMTLDEVIERFGGGVPPVFLGDGAVRHSEELAERLGSVVLPGPLGYPRAASLILLTSTSQLVGAEVREPAGWEPLYLRASGAERIAEARRAGGPQL